MQKLIEYQQRRQTYWASFIVIFLILSPTINGVTVQPVQLNIRLLPPETQFISQDISTNQLRNLGVFQLDQEDNQNLERIVLGSLENDPFFQRNIKITIFTQETTFSKVNTNGVDLKILIKAAEIAATFYQRILKVYTFDQSINNIDELFEKDCLAGSQQIAIPQIVKTKRFIGNPADHYIFLSYTYVKSELNGVSSRTIAYADSCNLILLSNQNINKVPRPPMSTITYNTFSIGQLIKKGQWNRDFLLQQLVKISVHEIGHPFGMQATFFAGIRLNHTIGQDGKIRINKLQKINSSYFKLKAGSNKRRKNLIKDYNQSNARINTEEINRLLKSQFNCSDQNVGALLAKGNSHWNSQVFKGEFMTPIFPYNQKITLLTLTLFESTGWYTNVDKSIAQEFIIGKNKGCSFLLLKNFTTEQSTSCIMFRQGQKRCNKQGNYIETCQNGQWTFKDILSIQSQFCPINADNKKCFNTLNLIGEGEIKPQCLKAQCNSDRTLITFSGSTENCSKFILNTVINVNNNDVLCPSSQEQFNSFCQPNRCPNWCSQTGFCVNGKCINQSISTFPCTVQNCQNCDASGKCFKCRQRFILKQANNTCLPQGQCQVKNCAKCYQFLNDFCQECNPFFKVVGYMCQSQLATAVECSFKLRQCVSCDRDSKKCYQCKPGVQTSVNSVYCFNAKQIPKSLFNNLNNISTQSSKFDVIDVNQQKPQPVSFGCQNQPASFVKSNLTSDNISAAKPNPPVIPPIPPIPSISPTLTKDPSSSINQPQQISLITSGCNLIIIKCLTCARNPPIQPKYYCLSCQEYYFLKDGKCQFCYNQIQGCLKCITSQQELGKFARCSLCRQGFRLARGQCMKLQ